MHAVTEASPQVKELSCASGQLRAREPHPCLVRYSEQAGLFLPMFLQSCLLHQFLSVSFWPRFQQEQAIVQDELVKVAKKEKEAAEKHLKSSLPKKRASPSREQQQSARLVSASSWAGPSASLCNNGQKRPGPGAWYP